jgi:ubiquitin carboxyl-terminal hydrolase 7
MQGILLDYANCEYTAAQHRFTPEESDWGFTRFAEQRKLFSVAWGERERPLVINGANMTAYVRIVKDETGVLWHNFIT